MMKMYDNIKLGVGIGTDLEKGLHSEGFLHWGYPISNSFLVKRPSVAGAVLNAALLLIKRDAENTILNT